MDEEERDATDQGIAWSGDRSVAEVAADEAERARAANADPGPSGPPASAEYRRRLLEGLGLEPRTGQLSEPCRWCSAPRWAWCASKGRPKPGKICPTRGAPPVDPAQG